MRDIEQSWINQLEVTGPIKSIMGFVDELSQNYDRRIAAIHTDYQKDIEEILAAYKDEKHDFQVQQEATNRIIAQFELELKSLQQSYKALNVEYKMAQESLQTTKKQLEHLKQELKNEEELLAIAQERIRVANEQVKKELELHDASRVEPRLEAGAINSKIEPLLEPEQKNSLQPPKNRFNKTREFLKQVIEGRKTRSIIFSKHNSAIPEALEADDLEDRDIFSY